MLLHFCFSFGSIDAKSEKVRLGLEESEGYSAKKVRIYFDSTA